MEIANYILSILKTNLGVVWSWGFHQPISIPDGLKFKVQGFKHTGWVIIKYNEETDLFDITLSNLSGEVLQIIEGIYLDELIDTIDYHVERVDDYDDRVKSEYSLL